jgi:glycerol-3-phosphate acyltransferase PlsY
MILLSTVAFLIGSIPFGLLLFKAVGKGDIRKFGSGNIGATNVFRTGTKKLAIITLLLDAGKGAAAVFIAQHHTPDLSDANLMLIGFFAVLGHCFTPWLKFKGGRGVATSIGVIMAVTPVLAFCIAALWLAVFMLSHISSLAAISAALAAPFLAWFTTENFVAIMIIPISVVVLIRHRDSIKRLLSGEEFSFSDPGKE